MTIDVGTLTEAVAGLCQARREATTDALLAKSTFDRRSEPGIGTIARVLRGSHGLLAGSMTRAVERLQANVATDDGRRLVADDIARLTELTREGLARIGVTARACEE